MIFDDSFLFISRYFEIGRLFSIIKDYLSVIGALFLIVNVISRVYFNGTYEFVTNFGTLIISVVLLIFFIAVLFKNKPQNSVVELIKGTDVSIEIKIGDFFNQNGDLIIGLNTTFDTETPTIISPFSIQGQYCDKFYKERDINVEIERSLDGIPFSEITSDKVGKRKKYPIGTVSLLKNVDHWAYLVAITNLNLAGNVDNPSIRNIQEALPLLWNHISCYGRTNPLVIPILGAGFSRIPITKDDLIKEIIRSFIPAITSKKFTEKLIIIIKPSDYKNTSSLDLNKLENFLKCQCSHYQIKIDTVQDGVEISN